ncbi:MAG: hypothetical protein ACRDY4_15240 [Acidimicrobiia bacterium]
MRGPRRRRVRRLRATVIVVALVAAMSVAGTTTAFAQAGDPSKSGDLAGNLPFAIYLLIPLALALAFLTAVLLGSRGDPLAEERRAGGVTRALERGRMAAGQQAEDS